MKSKNYDVLRLDSQLCFPLYACARKVIGLYKPYLDQLDITYTQYITLMVLWETPETTSKEIGRRLYLDSGTLTPLLKKLEEKGLIYRSRDADDERNLLVRLTDEGMALRESAVSIPEQIGACIKLSHEDAYELYLLLHRLLDSM